MEMKNRSSKIEPIDSPQKMIWIIRVAHYFSLTSFWQVLNFDLTQPAGLDSYLILIQLNYARFRH